MKDTSMNMCEEIKNMIREWESEGRRNDAVPSGARVEAAIAHACTCPECSRFHNLLQFILRDSDARVQNNNIIADAESASNADGAAIADRVMERIGALRTHAPSRPASGWKIPALTFAFLSVVLAGFIVLTTLAPKTTGDEILVRFRLSAPDALSVSLAGDFTDWAPIPLARWKNGGGEKGVWEIDLTLKKGNMYKYNFIIDDEEWIIDPDSSVRVDDGFGGQNSVIKI
jgi:hypothetical protein